LKRKKLLKHLRDMGCQFVRHGGNHDWYKNPITGKSQPVPRHSDVEENLNLARNIIRRLS